MAVYTQVSAEALGTFLARYDQGALVSAKGIAEGVQNSNYLVETTADRFILTLYEEWTSTDDLPFFLAMLDHLAAAGNPVPRALPDRDGWRFELPGGGIETLLVRLIDAGYGISGLSIERPGLHEAFVRIVGQQEAQP